MHQSKDLPYLKIQISTGNSLLLEGEREQKEGG
jgi:hypothetical protein